MLTVEQLELTLSKKYNLLVFVDLSVITQSPDQVYQLLKPFKNLDMHDRIVFYTSHEPSQQLWQHLHRALEILDIGGFFVMVCCAKSVELPFADAVTVMPIDLMPTADLAQGFHVPDTVCPLPWFHLEVKHNGNIHPCCVSTQTVGSANAHDLADVFFGPNMTRLRQEFMQGQRPAGCQHCWHLEQHGLKSNRQWLLEHNREKFYSTWINTANLRSLDLKPGNVCNFKCRICDDVNSSKFADEAKSYRIVSGGWREYDDYMWRQLDCLLPQIENLDFYGGEPFLVKQIPELLKSAVEQGHAKHIRLHFNTNGSVFPEWRALLNEFQSVDIAISIDAVGQQFEMERGGEWHTVEQNVKRFLELDAEVYIWCTVNIQNVLYLEQVIDWSRRTNIRVAWNYLDYPQWANIDRMTPAARQLVFERYAGSEHNELRNIAARVRASVGSDGHLFVTNMQRFDRLRNQNFAQTHPEMARAMGYLTSSQ